MDALRLALALSLLVASTACAAGGAAPPAGTAPASGPAPAVADPTNETFDGLALGWDAASVERRFGAPDRKGQPQEMGATGMFEADWQWTSLGLRLRMSAGTAEAAPTVGAIEIEAPSTLRTSRGIGVGATRAEVEAAYRDALDKGREPGEPDATSETKLIWLERAAKSRERFDLIVCDPPSFAPNERAKRTALAAYAKLHRACAALLADGGTLGAASCSSHVTLEDFLQTLGHDALGRSDLTVTETFGPPEDHPTPAAFPEGRYLKFVWVR